MIQLKKTIQQQSETFQDFEQTIERFVWLTCPDTPEQFACQLGVGSFIDSVRDIQVQYPLKFGCFAQMKVALVNALEYKAVKSDNVRMTG